MQSIKLDFKLIRRVLASYRRQDEALRILRSLQPHRNAARRQGVLVGALSRRMFTRRGGRLQGAGEHKVPARGQTATCHAARHGRIRQLRRGKVGHLMTVFAVYEVWEFEGDELVSLHMTRAGAEAKAAEAKEKYESVYFNVDIREMAVHP
jgi:hypothetical protein